MLRWFTFAVLCAAAQAQDWPQFGFDVASSGRLAGTAGINGGNIGALRGISVKIDGTVDSSPIYLHAVTIKGTQHSAFFVTTSYGKTLAIDADNGVTLWEYTPPKFKSWAGTAQITNSTPVADPDRQYIYAAAPDGAVQKLAVADGHALWTTAIALHPEREKIASALKVFHGHVIAVTGGYIGDRPPYQGHVAILDAQTGKLLHVWNSLCSDHAGLMDPASCPAVRSAIWGRAGAAIDEATGNIFIATGNGPYDGKANWGDSIVELDPDATKVLGNYTPADNSKLDSRDLDLGSTSPVLAGDGFLIQGGKDKLIRLLKIADMAGAAAHQDHEVQIVPAPARADVFTAPAIWHVNGDTWLYVADFSGTQSWILRGGKLIDAWKNSNAGTSPVFADDQLYVYDPNEGGLRVYNPVNGYQVSFLECGKGHWNSPIVVDRRIALPEGNANRHSLTGVLNIWSLPSR